MKLQAAIHLFLNEYQNAGTRRAYHDVLTPLSKHLGDDLPVAEIKPVDLVSYHQTLQHRNYSEATKRKHVKSIKTFFNWLVRFEIIDRSPAHAIKAKRLAPYISRDKAMKNEELLAVLDCAKWKPRDYALISFLADTGCRAGGAAGLKVKDLDLANNRATVTEKGNKTHMVAFGEKCAHAIERWLKYRLEHGIHAEYIFANRGERLTSATVSQILRRCCIKAGVRSLGSHSLRHRKGHQFADAKVAPSIAATALNHESFRTTLESYYPADFESAERELRNLSLDNQRPVDDKVIKFGG